MLKVFGFVRRNARLTHDEYRAGHVGYQNSFGRRLNKLRGYVLNVRANRALGEVLGEALAQRLTAATPAGFDELWDGWGQLMFDSLDDYLAARSPARDRAGPEGLEADPKVAEVGGDFDYLYGGSPFQCHVDERVSVAVQRPEHKLFKLAHFGKRHPDLAPELFAPYWAGRYAAALATVPGLRGLIINARTGLDVMNGFFAADAEGFTAAGAARRESFYGCWDAIGEYWFDDPAALSAAFGDARFAATLAALDQVLFDRAFCCEVDETVAVMPNRALAPAFYHR